MKEKTQESPMEPLHQKRGEEEERERIVRGLFCAHPRHDYYISRTHYSSVTESTWHDGCHRVGQS
jgi:hypothetical protein